MQPAINNQMCSLINAIFGTTQEEAEKIEMSTRDQADSAMWFEERRNGLTASQFAKICKRKKDINEKFINSLFGEVNTFTSPATSYGRANESVAKQVYLAKNTNIHIHDCGLVVNPQFSFLAATPDGKICINGQTGILEIKCPYSARDLTISEAANTVPNFCLVKLGTSHTLNQNHDYYFQVQGQLLVTGAPFCLFLVYTKKDMFEEQILPNLNFRTDMYKKLLRFYSQYGPKSISLHSPSGSE
ncbi:uncharacterized protein LOC135463829 isoform X2 [Liolophura sinensis]